MLVFNGCYHGTVDDTFVTLDEDGQHRQPPRPAGPGDRPDRRSPSAVEFNDLDGRRGRALATASRGDPDRTRDDQFLHGPAATPASTTACAQLATAIWRAPHHRRDTHDLVRAWAAIPRVHGLDPDIFVVGKCVAGGMPTAVWGLTEAPGRALHRGQRRPHVRPFRHGHHACRPTRCSSPASCATLAEVMTPDKAYAHMENGRARLAAGLGRGDRPPQRRPGMSSASARGSNSSAPPARCATGPRPPRPTSHRSRPRCTPAFSTGAA